MKLKTSQAEGEVLNYLVAQCEGYFDINMASVHEGVTDVFYFPRWQPTTDWAQGGPIIEREKIGVVPRDEDVNVWIGSIFEPDWKFNRTGPTPLIAAMRCYVASKLGDEVEVQDGLN